MQAHPVERLSEEEEEEEEEYYTKSHFTIPLFLVYVTVPKPAYILGPLRPVNPGCTRLRSVNPGSSRLRSVYPGSPRLKY